MEDRFNGDNAKLVSAIEALLDLDASGSLVPHGVGGHARTMLEAAAVRLSASKPAAPEGWKLVPVALTERMRDEADFAMQQHVGDDYTESDDFDGWYQPIWSAMLAASPAAPAQSAEPIYQVRLANGSWKDINERAYQYNLAHCPEDSRIVYACPQPSPTAVVLDDERAACVHADEPKACYRVRCQLGNKCVDDDMAPRRAASPQPVEQTHSADLEAEIERLTAIIHSPESEDFLKGVAIEAEYQRQLHGIDATEARFDWHQWFWVTGYLLGKALAAYKSGEENGDKARHHLVTTAALINNWHNTLTGKPAASVHSNSGKPVADLIASQPESRGVQ